MAWEGAVKKIDRRQLLVIIVVALFMAVTVGHVASYTGSFEPAGWEWLGILYALAVDASIGVCALLTRWTTTKKWALRGYVVFTLADGIFNVGHVKPWATDVPITAWVYALFPTASQALLGMLVRDAGAFRKKSDTDEKTTKLRVELRAARAELTQSHDRARAVLQETHAELQEAHAELREARAELARPRELAKPEYADFVQLCAGMDGQLATMRGKDANLALVRAGFAPISGRTAQDWVKRARKAV